MATCTSFRGRARLEAIQQLSQNPSAIARGARRQRRSCRRAGPVRVAGRLKVLTPSRASAQQVSLPYVPLRSEPTGEERIADENITTVFRWPAALGGKEVSVVGGHCYRAPFACHCCVRADTQFLGPNELHCLGST